MLNGSLCVNAPEKQRSLNTTGNVAAELGSCGIIVICICACGGAASVTTTVQRVGRHVTGWDKNVPLSIKERKKKFCFETNTFSSWHVHSDNTINTQIVNSEEEGDEDDEGDEGVEEEKDDDEDREEDEAEEVNREEQGEGDGMGFDPSSTSDY